MVRKRAGERERDNKRQRIHHGSSYQLICHLHLSEQPDLYWQTHESVHYILTLTVIWGIMSHILRALFTVQRLLYTAAVAVDWLTQIFCRTIATFQDIFWCTLTPCLTGDLSPKHRSPFVVIVLYILLLSVNLTSNKHVLSCIISQYQPLKLQQQWSSYCVCRVASFPCRLTLVPNHHFWI